MRSHETLTQIALQEMLEAFGLDRMWGRHWLLEPFFRGRARQFARILYDYDAVVERDGFQAGSAWLMDRLAPGFEVIGQANLPAAGPLLIVSNHPGLYDATALVASVARNDLRVIAEQRRFLSGLPATGAHLLAVPEHQSGRLKLIRNATRHLWGGGALLTFPAGTIEPDPAVLPDAETQLEQWSQSLALFVRLSPNLVIVPAVVSGVLSAAALRHPLARLRHSERDQRWLSATLQLLRPALQDITVRVQFGTPVVPATLNCDASSVNMAVVEQVRAMMSHARS